jgi:uncharacterized phage protein (TIGR02220 family)
VGDNFRWWKLWYSALSDPAVLSLPPALRWAWAALGAFCKVHGAGGVLHFDGNLDGLLSLALYMGVRPEAVRATCARLPGVRVVEGAARRGPGGRLLDEGRKSYSENLCTRKASPFSVVFSNWRKYQVDRRRSTSRKSRKQIPSPLLSSISSSKGVEVQEEGAAQAPALFPVEQPAPKAKGPKAKPSREACATCAEVLAELNRLTARPRGFSAVGQGGAFLHSRHQETSREDCLRVVRVMVAKWKGRTIIDRDTGETVSMEDYLRPSTLFRPSRFAEYVTLPERRERPAPTQAGTPLDPQEIAAVDVEAARAKTRRGESISSTEAAALAFDRERAGAAARAPGGKS